MEDEVTPRQEEMALLAKRGAGNEEIAQRLSLTARELGEEWSNLEQLLNTESQEQSVEAVLRRLLEKARAALEAENARFALIVGLPKGQALLTLDSGGIVSGVSKEGPDLLGIPCEKMIGLPIDSILDARTAGIDQSADEMRRATEGDSVESERMHRRNDGSTFLAHHCVLALVGPSGHTSGFIRVIRDLEWRRVHELRVAELEHTISLLVKEPNAGK